MRDCVTLQVQIGEAKIEFSSSGRIPWMEKQSEKPKNAENVATYHFLPITLAEHKKFVAAQKLNAKFRGEMSDKSAA